MLFSQPLQLQLLQTYLPNAKHTMLYEYSNTRFIQTVPLCFQCSVFSFKVLRFKEFLSSLRLGIWNLGYN